MSLKEMKGESIHGRVIEVETFSVDGEKIIVEGRLNDTRRIVSYTLSGNRREPGPIHGMIARFLIGGTPPTILDAEAEMPTIPMEECVDAGASIKKLIGLPVIYGFSKTVKERLGGPAGCNHLTALVLTVGSAIIQGFATNRNRGPLPPESKSLMLGYVKNSCMLWKEDGELYKKLLDEIG